ncbi:MAG: GNAT family N-acetyltransferase [Armatimonadota bacterium]
MGTQVNIRSYEPGDIYEVVGLLNRNLVADPLTIEAFQRKVLLDQNYDPKGSLVACCGESIVGYALGMVRRFPLEDAAPDFDRSWITLLAVDSDYRRRGIGTRLVGGLEEYFKSRSCNITIISGYAPNYFIPGVDPVAYPEALEFFKNTGFGEVYRPLSMDADLLKLATPEWVPAKEQGLVDAGVVFEPYNPELILPLLDFMKAEFPGDWQRFLRDAMTRITTGEYHPTNLWIAHVDGRVLGFAMHDNNCRFGPFGVAAKERGRGLGVVLLLRILYSMKAKGLHNAWFLWTDEAAARVYDVGGFKESRRFAYMRKSL